jgi:hypothetical protein
MIVLCFLIFKLPRLFSSFRLALPEWSAFYRGASRFRSCYMMGPSMLLVLALCAHVLPAQSRPASATADEGKITFQTFDFTKSFLACQYLSNATLYTVLWNYWKRYPPGGEMPKFHVPQVNPTTFLCLLHPAPTGWPAPQLSF